MKTLITTFLLAFSLSASANLYECKEGSKEPVAVQSLSTVDFASNPAHLFPKSTDLSVHGTRKPFLVYYAVDSSEPFMQLTVKYEVAALKIACQNSNSVNFVAFLNSLYTEKNEFITCKDGNYKNVNLTDYPELNKKLKLKNNFIRSGDHTDGELGPMDYLVQYRSHLNESFGKFPLAHPDFLYDLINFSMSDADLFPAASYMPFLNLKSHGSKTNVLSGLLDCQVKAKTLTQEVSLKNAYTAEEIQFLMNADFSENFKLADTLLEKIGLGSSVAVGGSQLGGTNLGGTNLGTNRFSLGGTNLSSTISGLGAGNGLGSEFSFGLYHVGLTAVFSHLFNEDNQNILGFAMLESCDTDRNVEFHHASIDNVLGLYSAKHSLWYRNLNWASIMYEANGSTQRLVELLNLHTSKIENVIVR